VRRSTGVALAALLIAGTVIAGAPAASATKRDDRPRCDRPPATAGAPPSAIDPYRAAVAAAGARGLQVWLESDLLARWWQGTASFQAGVQRLKDLAADPAVVGFKIADELGYGDVVQNEPSCLRAFIVDSVRALHQASPRAQVLIDLVVPDLGCAPGVASVADHSLACQASNDARYPALTLPEVDKLVALRAVDVIDLSTGLLDGPTYQSWGTNLAQAQRAAWREVGQRHWSDEVTLNGRKALAHPDSYPGTAATAAADTSVFVDTPIDRGARAVDVWTWRQQYQGGIYRLADPGLRTNPLWDALVARHDRGDVLLTHFSPSSVEEAVGPDLDMIAQAFRGVFVAAGTG
jgi:hypothetical protein